MAPALPSPTTWEGSTALHWQQSWRIPMLRVHPETTSTNDDARTLANAGAPAGTTVIAEYQTAGRGREGRAWAAEAGLGLLFSVLLRSPREDATQPAGPTPIRIGLAVCSAILGACGLRARLKWPNDIVAPDGRKLGGILCEAASGAGSPFVVAGIGINVFQHDDQWPPELEGLATSIRAASGRMPERPALARAILDRLRPFRLAGPELGPGEMRTFRRLDALRGQDVTVDGVPAGVAVGIRPDGALLVRTPAGVRVILSGTVRPAPAGPGRPSGRRATATHNRDSR